MVVPVAIDGTTQPGVPAGTKGITLDGDLAGSAEGLVLAPDSDGSTIRGLAISGFGNESRAGIRVQSNDNVIAGNYIGTEADGTGSNGNARASSWRGTTTRSAADRATQRHLRERRRRRARRRADGTGAHDNVVDGQLDSRTRSDGNDGPGNVTG